MNTTTCQRQQLSASDQVEIMRHVMREHPTLDPHHDADFDKLYNHFTSIAQDCGTATHGHQTPCCGTCHHAVREAMQAWWCE